MDTDCRIKPEWIPEAYKAQQKLDNSTKLAEIAKQPPLPHNGLYGYRKKQIIGSGYVKK